MSPPLPADSQLVQSIATCFEARGDAQALKQALVALLPRAEEEAQLAVALLELSLAKLGDASARENLQGIAGRLLGWYRSGEGARLAGATPHLTTLWTEAASTLASFEARRFAMALKACWAAREDAAALEAALEGLTPDGAPRVEFARCLFHLKLVKLGRQASRAEFSRRVSVLQRAWTDVGQREEWLGPDEGLRELWQLVTPMLAAFFQQQGEAPAASATPPADPVPTAPSASAGQEPDQAPRQSPPQPEPPPESDVGEHVPLPHAPVERVPGLAGFGAPQRTPPARADRPLRTPPPVRTAEPATDPARQAVTRADLTPATTLEAAPVPRASRPGPAAPSPQTAPTPRPPPSAPRPPVGGDGLFTADLLTAAMASQQPPRGRTTPTQPAAEAVAPAPPEPSPESTVRDAPAVSGRAFSLQDTWPDEIQAQLDRLPASPPLVPPRAGHDTLPGLTSAALDDAAAPPLARVPEAEERTPPEGTHAPVHDVTPPAGTPPPGWAAPPSVSPELPLIELTPPAGTPRTDAVAAAASAILEVEITPPSGTAPLEADWSQAVDAPHPAPEDWQAAAPAPDIDVREATPAAGTRPLPGEETLREPAPVPAVEVTATTSSPFGGPQFEAELIDAAVDAMSTEATPESALLGDDVDVVAEESPPPPPAIPPVPLPPPPPDEEAEVVEAVELAPPAIAPIAPPPPPAHTPAHGIPRIAPVVPPARPSRPPQRVSLDLELPDYTPDGPSLAFWQHTIKVLDLLPVPGQQRVARRLLPAETKEERQSLLAFVRSIEAAMNIPDARAFACLLELTCAGQQKEKGLFGKVNEQRREGFQRALALLAPAPEAAARACAWFDFDGPITEGELWQGLEVVLTFLGWCHRHQRSPLDHQAQAEFLRAPAET